MQAHHIPNLISTARIALVYPIILLLLHREFSWALSLMVVAGLTDALDGWLARHYHWQSKLGSWLDPAADKLLLVTGYVALASLNLLPVWLAVAVIVRDIIILIGAGAYYYRVGPFTGQPLPISKVNTFLQLVLLVMVIQGQTLWMPSAVLLNILTLTVLISTIISGVCYVYVWSLKYYRHHDPSS